MSFTETNRNIEGLIERGLSRFGIKVTDAPDPLKRCGFSGTGELQRALARNGCHIRTTKAERPLKWAEAVSMADAIRKATANVERHPPAPLNPTPTMRPGRTMPIPADEFHPIGQWLKRVGILRASRETGISYDTLRGVMVRGSCGPKLAERLKPHVTCR